MTLFCELRTVDVSAAPATEVDAPKAPNCVYKPIRGERPLDDFPIGTLAYREVAAYELSQETGWRIVPPTVLRDGPLGEGMVQAWIEIDDDADIVEMILTRDPRLRRMALFDAIVNNADRKGGHVLPTDDGHLHGCDHGVCFAVDPKLRTVLWGWRGEPLTDEEVACLKTLRGSIDGDLGRRLADLLSGPEVAATARRLDRLLSERKMPLPDPYRPAIPWPPF
ncbi:MAG: SCO1664 family protein [Chloroflexota bacterium]|nr:SCO1664 family protein [Chloroflexota bacterium]